MKDEHRSLLELLRSIIPITDNKIALKALKAFQQVPVPRNVGEADMIAAMYRDNVGLAIGCCLLYHISNHDGEECAPGILEHHLKSICRDVLDIIADGCSSCNLANPFEASDHNADMVAEILKELNKSGDI